MEEGHSATARRTLPHTGPSIMEDRVCQQHNGAEIKITPVPVGGTNKTCFHALIQSCVSPAGTRRKWTETKSIMHELRVKGDRGVMSHAFLMLISDSIRKIILDLKQKH